MPVDNPEVALYQLRVHAAKNGMDNLAKWIKEHSDQLRHIGILHEIGARLARGDTLAYDYRQPTRASVPPGILEVAASAAKRAVAALKFLAGSDILVAYTEEAPVGGMYVRLQGRGGITPYFTPFGVEEVIADMEDRLKKLTREGDDLAHELGKTTRSQRENLIAGALHKNKKKGRGAARTVWFPERIREVMGLDETHPAAANRGYIYLRKLHESTLNTLIGMHARQIRAKYAHKKAKKERPEFLPEGPWKKEIPKSQHQRIRHEIEKSDHVSIEDLPSLWPSIEIYRKEWKEPWWFATNMAIAERHPDVVKAMTQDPEEADAELRHSASEGTILEIGESMWENGRLPKEVYKFIRTRGGLGMNKARGEDYFYRTRSRGRRKPTVSVRQAVKGLQDLGYRIAYTFEPSSEEEALWAKAEYYREKEEIAATRSAKKKRVADAAYSAAKAVGDRIPAGQPILVGHHSEGRHRRDIARMHASMSKSADARSKAAHYHERAKRARRKADRAEAAARRVEKKSRED